MGRLKQIKTKQNAWRGGGRAPLRNVTGSPQEKTQVFVSGAEADSVTMGPVGIIL